LDEEQLNYLRAIHVIVTKKFGFTFSWLGSETIMDDIRNLFTLNLPSTDCWSKLIEAPYHSLSPETLDNEEQFKK